MGGQVGKNTHLAPQLLGKISVQDNVNHMLNWRTVAIKAPCRAKSAILDGYSTVSCKWVRLDGWDGYIQVVGGVYRAP